MRNLIKKISLFLVAIIVANSTPVFADIREDLISKVGNEVGEGPISRLEREEIKNGLDIEDLILTEEEIAIFNDYLTELTLSNNTNLDKNVDFSTLPDQTLNPSYLTGLAGTFAIPGVGQVVITIFGAIVVAGITISVTSTLARKISDWIYTSKKKAADSAKSKIPSSVKDSNGNVDIGKFSQRVNGKSAWKDPKSGWEIEKDTSNHRGYDGSIKKWKIKDRSGNRIGSLNSDGKVIDK